MSKRSLWFFLLLAMPLSNALAAEQPAANGHEQQVSGAAEAQQEAAADEQTTASASDNSSAADSASDNSEESRPQPEQREPKLSPTEYVNALIPALTVARDLGRNCHAVLEQNSADKKVCDQFDRGLKNLAARQKEIESDTPRPSDTSSVDPQLMKRFNIMQDELRSETEYLRAYRATQ